MQDARVSPLARSSCSSTIRDERRASAFLRSGVPVDCLGTGFPAGVLPTIQNGHSQSNQNRRLFSGTLVECTSHSAKWRLKRTSESWANMPYHVPMIGTAVKFCLEVIDSKCLAPRHGFEPRFTAPKAAVLPLDDPGMVTRRDSPSSVPVRSPLPQHQRQIIFAPAPYRYNEKRKAIWTGVRGGLQNRSAADEVAGVFDSHCLPPCPSARRRRTGCRPASRRPCGKAPLT